MSIKFEKIKPGMTLYDVRRNNGLDSYRNKWNIWPVAVYEVDSKTRKVFASWNHNKPKWVHERHITQYRAKRPTS